MNETETPVDYVDLTADIVAAYVSNNPVPAAELASLIGSIHGALIQIGTGRAMAQPQAQEPQQPAVPIKKSIQPDFLVCLEDGRTFKSLKRHLRAKYNLSPEQYRAKWGLPPDYPMVAPNYAKARSDLAKAIGLGQPRPDYDAAA
ncbi:MucR family transcriptional regulator [Methylorubrum populi]|uniref:MucR family transcriptional regulator n=1 Tax=Methylorubrum populi TaxID=223967 RepID=A0A921E6B0_9HYPH|nr:MucR family transcriptional regulator [Methylorubrum populi]